MVLTSLTGQIETWHQKHFDANGWTGPDLEKLYVRYILFFILHSSSYSEYAGYLVFLFSLHDYCIIYLFQYLL